MVADSLAPAGVAVVPHAHPTSQALMAQARMNLREPLVQVDYVTILPQKARTS